MDNSPIELEQLSLFGDEPDETERPSGHVIKKKPPKYADPCGECMHKIYCNRKPVRDENGRCMTFRSFVFADDYIAIAKREMAEYMNSIIKLDL